MFVLAEPAVTLRATLTPTSVEEAAWPDPARAPVAELRRWLSQTWQDTSFPSDAVRMASPALAELTDRVCGGEGLPPERVRRCAASLMRYLLRARFRPTPFGLFAGVAPATVGTATCVVWGQYHQVVARPDARWLSGYSNRIDARAHPDLRVVRASTLHVSGNRLIRSWLPGATPDEAAPVSVRHTPATELVLHLARVPRPLGELENALCEAFTSAARETVSATLALLLRHRILISAAHPPMAESDPLGCLLERVPDQEQAATRVHQLLSRHNTTHHAAEHTGLREQALRHLAEADPEHARLAVDTRLDAQVTLSSSVVEEVQKAANTLLAWAPHRTGSSAWLDYHQRCLERYGPGALIALTDLVGSTGIGWPAGYRGSFLPAPEQHGPTARDHTLTQAAHTAALAGEVEVDLLALPQPGQEHEAPAPPHLEVRAQIQASTPQAVDEGKLTLWITGVSRAVGVLTGRFFHLDGIAAGGYENLPTLTEGAVPVQLSAPPLVDSAHNIARTTSVLPRLLVIDEHPPPVTLGGPQVFGIDDVSVRVDPDHLRLQRRSTGQIIEPHLFSALEPRWHTHLLVRLCYELPRARTAPHLAFAWPISTDTWTHLPRVRAANAVLSPALWRVRADDIAAPDTDASEWCAALRGLQRQRRIPDHVQVMEGETYLALDLSQAAHQHLLRTHLERRARQTSAILIEAPLPGAFAWCQGRAHEVVVPLASTQAPARAPRPSLTFTPPSVHLPGAGTWTSAHLYCDADLHSRLLTDHTPQLWKRWGSEPAWWVVRYSDHDGPHLRLRIPTSGAHQLSALACWARELEESGLLRHMTLETYRPETGRYGSGEALQAAHTLFSADTAAALTQLRHAAFEDTTRLHALGAASLVDLATAACPERGLEWLTEHLPRARTPIDRTAHTLAVDHLGAATESVLSELQRAWRNRAEALAAYRAHLPGPDSIHDVLPSLLHMHHNRLIGPDHTDETRLLELTRAVALTLSARARQGTR
ncbi:lantibiotic dehydratase [Nocardiopsis synnemataformans]|uniref:lantibiotic dehydratase n=1 Tax=Nocardiopsis synnemataformans TaxID=61305 RepID=UPI003EBFB40E